MSERTTRPLPIADIEDIWRDNCPGSGDACLTAWEAAAMAHELRSRRTRDLSTEEREALRWLRERAHTHLDITSDAEECPHCTAGKAAIAALDKLLATDGGERG